MAPIGRYRHESDMRSICARVMMLCGMAVLMVALAGQWSSLGNYESAPPRAWERYDPQLAARTPTYASLLEEAARRSGAPLSASAPAKTMQTLFDVVAERFTFKSADHNVFSNWLLWGLGQVHPAFNHIRSERTLVERGHSAFCSQASFLLMSLANDVGIRSRHVGLNGHVVMEAFYAGAWHLYDPDLEVIPTAADGSVVSVSALADDPALLERAYDGARQSVIPYIRSIEDNTFVSYPAGSWFVWKSEVLSHVETVAEYAKFTLPVMLILFGLWLNRPLSRSRP